MGKTPETFSDLLPYCQTYRQRQLIEACAKAGSARAAAKSIGASKSSVQEAVNRVKEYAARKGWAPDHAMGHPVAPGFEVSGTSTLRNQDGEVVMQWQKTRQDDEARLEAMRAAVKALCEDVKPAAPVKFKGPTMNRLMSVYPLADPHIGMYASAVETGCEWTTEHIEQALNRAIDYLVDWSLPAKRGVLLVLGDLFHTENMDGTTSRSKHVLDLSGRFPNHIEVGLRVLRRAAYRMLKKHEIVDFLFVPGNHDETLIHAMRAVFAMLYENEPRLTVNSTCAERQYLEHGTVLLGAVHGHKTKDEQLPGLMATEQPQAWGRTTYRHFFRGHDHHDNRKEYNGCTVEHVKCPNPGDAHSISNGYLSKPGMKCIIFDGVTGDSTRNEVGPAMFMGDAEGVA